MLPKVSEAIKKRENNMRKTMHVFSHDLRNPLLNIQALIQEANALVLDANHAERTASNENLTHILEQDLPEVLELLQSSAARMDDMVLSANEIYHCLFDELECEYIDMREIFLRCFAQLKLADKNLELSCLGMPMIFADTLTVHRIVSEVLSNAYKAIEAKKGHCSRVIKVEAMTSEDFITFYIEDFGCGIKNEELKRVFEPFFSGQDFKKGTGMGLTRAKALVERYSGHMELRSKGESGTIVRFTLPQSALST